jgi:Cu-processing system ATP-binding protein
MYPSNLVKLKALNNVSVTCNKGECIALIGPKWQLVKQTFIKSILGMVVPIVAFITFNGKKYTSRLALSAVYRYMPQIGPISG